MPLHSRVTAGGESLAGGGDPVNSGRIHNITFAQTHQDYWRPTRPRSHSESRRLKAVIITIYHVSSLQTAAALCYFMSSKKIVWSSRRHADYGMPPSEYKFLRCYENSIDRYNDAAPSDY